MLDAKVLLVDDDLEFCRLMERILTHEGAQVSTTSNGQEALRLFDQEQPDLVILDVLMEGIDGFETCRRLRQRSDVPIIMLSGVDQTDYMVRGMACGADDYITKPFHLTVLCARIRAALRRAGHAAALSSQPERRGGWAAF